MLKINKELNGKYIEFYRAVFKEKRSLDLKTKELIALGVALGRGCLYCYNEHAEKAHQAGATYEEMREAIAVAEAVTAGSVRMYVLNSTFQPKETPQNQNS